MKMKIRSNRENQGNKKLDLQKQNRKIDKQEWQNKKKDDANHCY